MRLRWRFHNLLLQQSLDFFHNDFAGRLSAKVMQTSLAVREFWVILGDMLAYVLIYFVTISLVLGGNFSTTDCCLCLLWLVLFICAACFFIPRLSQISSKQADARAVMTGRVTDAYTNIQTVKLFAHAGRESKYAKASMQDFMVTVYKQMRLGTQYEISINLLSVVFIWWRFRYCYLVMDQRSGRTRYYCCNDSHDFKTQQYCRIYDVAVIRTV